VSPDRVRNTVEAALLAAGRPLALEALLELFEPESQEAVERPTRDHIREALGRLAEEYAGRGIELREVASGFRIQVRPEYARRLGRLWAERPARYSRALLETLALVAYRQPISRAEIEEVRGVSVSSSIFKTLQDREWVRVVGHRDTPGRPALYGTTRQFLDDFNLRQLSDLPPLSELQDPDRVTGDLFEALVVGAAAPADADSGAAEEPPGAGAPGAGSGPGWGSGIAGASGPGAGAASGTEIGPRAGAASGAEFEPGVGTETGVASGPGGGS
jgi:segregation and condensation protein B